MEQADDKSYAAIVRSPRGDLTKPSSALIRRGRDDLARILKEDRGRILLVSCDSINLDSYEQLLRADGHVVQTASGAKEVSEIAHTFLPQVVMLPLELGTSGTDWIQLGMELSDLLPHTQIAFFSSLHREQYRDLWAKGYNFEDLPSHFTHEDLLFSVREFVNRSMLVDQAGGFLNAAYLRKNLQFWTYEGEPFSVLFFAVRSHQQGQETNSLLKIDRNLLGAISQQVSRHFDYFALYRHGENRFALWCLLRHDRSSIVSRAMPELRKLFDETNWAQLVGKPVKLSATFAVVSFPDEGRSTEEILARADQLL